MFEQMYREDVCTKRLFMCYRFASSWRRVMGAGSFTPECDLIRSLFSGWWRQDVTISFIFILSGRLLSSALTILGGGTVSLENQMKAYEKTIQTCLCCRYCTKTHWTLNIVHTNWESFSHISVYRMLISSIDFCKCQAVYLCDLQMNH